MFILLARYVDKLKMAGPSDNIDVVLDATARRIGALQAGGTSAAWHILGLSDVVMNGKYK